MSDIVMVLIEKPAGEGMSLSDSVMLLAKIKKANFIPIEIDAAKHESSAMGYINLEFADKLNYDYAKSGLIPFVQNILDDTEEETLSGLYDFNGNTIYITR